jgi:hypothetical protein
MKKLINYSMIAFFATIALSIAAPDKDALMEKEKAAWQAFKDKKADDFKKVVSADMVGVYVDGTADMQKEMDGMQKWDMKSFAISDFKITSAGPNIIITTYVVQIEGTFDGKDAGGTYNAGSVWKKMNGAWQAIFHTNVPAAKPTG